MHVALATDPGTPEKPSEDWALASPDLVVVLDGATVRIDTGCIHGVSWFAHQLGAALVSRTVIGTSSLAAGLAEAIDHVAALHPQCDLAHLGTPSAAVGIVRVSGDVLEYLVLGDITLLLDLETELRVVTDDRVSQTAQPARGEAERLPIGSVEKTEALLRMKHGELAARNRPGGYWVAASDPSAVEHALVGTASLTGLSDIALLTDGAARAAAFGLMGPRQAMDCMRVNGPGELIRQVRRAEDTDPLGLRWPRNKKSDDATAVFAAVDRSPGKEGSITVGVSDSVVVEGERTIQATMTE